MDQRWGLSQAHVGRFYKDHKAQTSLKVTHFLPSITVMDFTIAVTIMEHVLYSMYDENVKMMYLSNFIFT